MNYLKSFYHDQLFWPVVALFIAFMFLMAVLYVWHKVTVKVKREDAKETEMLLDYQNLNKRIAKAESQFDFDQCEADINDFYNKHKKVKDSSTLLYELRRYMGKRFMCVIWKTGIN